LIAKKCEQKVKRHNFGEEKKKEEKKRGAVGAATGAGVEKNLAPKAPNF
jgi:hypothetical protein